MRIHMRVAGLTLFSRSSSGDIILASYHPRQSLTWHWSISLGARNGNRMICRAPAALRRGQWHDFYNLGSVGLCVSRQEYHKREAIAA